MARTGIRFVDLLEEDTFREKLEETPESPTLILTVPGRGYRVRER